jgi:hypothetical protein
MRLAVGHALLTRVASGDDLGTHPMDRSDEAMDGGRNILFGCIGHPADVFPVSRPPQ